MHGEWRLRSLALRFIESLGWVIGFRFGPDAHVARTAPQVLTLPTPPPGSAPPATRWTRRSLAQLHGVVAAGVRWAATIIDVRRFLHVMPARARFAEKRTDDLQAAFRHHRSEAGLVPAALAEGQVSEEARRCSASGLVSRPGARPISRLIAVGLLPPPRAGWLTLITSDVRYFSATGRERTARPRRGRSAVEIIRRRPPVNEETEPFWKAPSVIRPAEAAGEGALALAGRRTTASTLEPAAAGGVPTITRSLGLGARG